MQVYKRIALVEDFTVKRKHLQWNVLLVKLQGQGVQF